MAEQWREVTVDWKGEDDFIGRNSRGGTVLMSSSADKQAVGPMEMLLLGVAGCTGIDIVSILQKKRQTLQDMQVIVRGKRAETYPMVYTDIEVVYYLWGDDLDPKAVEQAIQLSEEKYCSASAMLRAVAKFKSSYEILPAEESGAEKIRRNE
jgi:putative redox protein